MSPEGSGLSLADLTREAARFGVSDEQVQRDHAISHILAALAQDMPGAFVFFGGTALSRTHLTASRLSEDIDLIAVESRDVTASKLIVVVNRALLRTHGRAVWTAAFSMRDDQPAVVELPGGISIRVQVLRNSGYEPWPTELRAVEQRYRDAPQAKLIVPTAAAFAGWKTATWHDRRASRDLYDLWALAEVGLLTPEAASLFVRHGPIGAPPREFMFRDAPREDEWQASLAGQTRLTVTAAQALSVVRTCWATALDEQWEDSAPWSAR